MNFLHKRMKVHPPFFRHRRGFEKQIHHHGLAGADIAVDVEPLRGIAALRPRQTEPGAPTLVAGRRLEPLQCMVKALQLFRRQLLSGVGAQIFRSNLRPVFLEGTLGHRQLDLLFVIL